MSLKRIFTTGEQAVYRIAQEVAESHGVEVLAKVRIADAIKIENSGISNEEYSYALKAHFDVLVIQKNWPLIAIEFDGAGHDPKNDDIKNQLCNYFELPLIRVNMAHINSKNFEDSAVHFFLYQLFGVDQFLEEYGNDPYEIYDPMFFISAPGKDRQFPFHYAARWCGRLKSHFQQHLELFDGAPKKVYEHGMVNWGASEGIWERNSEFRAVCGQLINDDERIIGTETLAIQVFGMSDLRRENYLHIWPFVIGLAAGNMYENALAFVGGDRRGVMNTDELHHLLVDWTEDGFQARIAYNLPVRWGGPRQPC